MRSSKKTLWFDFDGTLVSVKERFERVHQEICGLLGIKPLPAGRLWQFRQEGRSTRQILSSIDGEQYYDDYIRARTELIESPKMLKLDSLRDGAIETLAAVAPRYDVRILSGRANAANLRQQIEHLGISEFIQQIHVVSPYGQHHEKADVLAAHGTENRLILGDTPHDVLAGKTANCTTCAVQGGMSTVERLRESKPDHMIEHLSQLPGIIHEGEPND